mmetsp:Transcript_2214/g.5045  ORF Transcript_2214/g.5045 Transcript_2214/m.5045 type:complete len:381 (+) Transcript_2214:364-1506(+)|eukprot:CAMPEP_0114533614 /NCGR_PEP_ID=MMETSP0109-20121206/27350_1 /TAXON_ID=29199 /ORGANISM="Chlorarachnion reptans, Strain CCCM449" /LENGTH=380 /DNA_ID=CAMNT_0001716871 /DNA_START=273 /DNA_END=1415 /DNA_ORIENTATION=+
MTKDTKPKPFQYRVNRNKIAGRRHLRLLLCIILLNGSFRYASSANSWAPRNTPNAKACKAPPKYSKFSNHHALNWRRTTRSLPVPLPFHGLRRKAVYALGTPSEAAVPRNITRTLDTELVRWTKDNLVPDAGGAFLQDPANLREDVKLISPLWRVQGKSRYVQTVESWRENLRRLPEAETIITEMVEPIMGQGIVRVRWETRWVPPDLLWLAQLRRKLPQQLEINIMAVGEPLAVVHGVSLLEFQTNNSSPMLVKQTDQLEMEKVFSDNRIQQRRFGQRLYEDLVIFLSTRRPLGWSAADWAQRILNMLDLSSVGAPRVMASAASLNTDPEERKLQRKREKLGFGVALILTGIATLIGSDLKKKFAAYELEKSLIEEVLD